MCEAKNSQSTAVEICPMHKKEGINIPPQPLCRLKAISGSVLDKLGDRLPKVGKPEKQQSFKVSRGCLCSTIKPILKLSELVGVVPMVVFHPGESSEKCQLIFKSRSFGAVINTMFILGFVGYIPFSFVEIKGRMSEVFTGTDLYTFTFHGVAMILETTVLLVSGRFFRCKFMRGWAELNEVYHGLCDAAADLQRIKVGSYIAVFIVVLEHILVFIFSFYEANNCSLFKHRGYLIIVVESLRINLTWLIPTSLSLMFFFICLLIRSHFITISEMLACILKKPNPKLHTKIDMVRILHEQLCETVSDFESYFGVQILITLCTSCFMITVGAYSYIVQGEGISTASYENAGWASKGQMYGAILMIIAIVTGGEMVTNAAVSSAPVLNSLSLTTLDDKSQVQVTAFLQKISAFPTKIRALRITTVSTTFLASASKNIITYLLVLMQFKLSLENSKKDHLNLPSFSGNHNTSDDGRLVTNT